MPLAYSTSLMLASGRGETPSLLHHRDAREEGDGKLSLHVR